MSTILRTIIDHHIWANDTLYRSCESLTPEQLVLTVPGTFGPIHKTLVHIAEAEQIYLSRIPETGIGHTLNDEAERLASIPKLRAVLAENAEAWRAVVAENAEAWRAVVARWPEDHAFTYRTRRGGVERKTVAFSVVQMLDHGSEHRNHIRTILSAHGIAPPEIDGWVWDETRPDSGS